MKKKIHKLPEGMFTKKQFAIYIATFFLFLGIVPFLILTFNTKDRLYSILAIVYTILCGILIIVLTNLLSPLYKIQKERNYSGDVKKYIDELEKLKSDLVKDETYNYLNIMIVNSYFNYDLSKANELFVTLKKPTVKKYAMFYQLVEVCYYINNERYDEAREAIKTYSSVNGVIQKSSNLVDIYNNPEYKLDNIEKIYPINTKKVFINVNNASTLLSYYLVRNDLVKAKEYASFILKQNTNMEVDNSLARKVLEGDVNESSR